MTREEAIAVLQTIKPTPCRGDGKSTTHTLEIIAIDMAIKALEQQPCEDCISRQAVLSMQYRIDDSATLSTRDVVNVDDIEDLPSVTPQRDNSVLECVRMREPTPEERESVKKYIDSISTTIPLPKIGEWLEKEVVTDKVIEEWQSARCNVCDKYHTTPYMYYFSDYNYCPYCGSRMEKDKEEQNEQQGT